MRWSYARAILKPLPLLSSPTIIARTIPPELVKYQSSSPCTVEYLQKKVLNTGGNGFCTGRAHALVIKSGSFEDLHTGNCILNLYARAGDSVGAQKLFDEIPDRDVKSWTILLSGFSRSGLCRVGLDFFRKMQQEGVIPNRFTLSVAFKCCCSNNELRIGKAIHGWVICSGIDLDTALLNSILDLYAKCEAFVYAKRVFISMTCKDIVSWNIMIGTYLELGHMEMALVYFLKLPIKDVSSWNTIIDRLMKVGFERIALDLLYEMVKVGPAFDKVTFSTSLVLVSSLTVLILGRQIHGRVLRIGVHDDGFVRTSLIEMYRKCRQIEKASAICKTLLRDTVRTTFSYDESVTDCISWNSMIAGYVQNGMMELAFNVFNSMVCANVEMNKFTLTTVISACASAGLLELGQQIHANILKAGHNLDVFLCSSMIDMYCKCGRLNDALLVFKKANFQNVALWTSMISGFALYGKGREAIQLFESMQNEGIRPNEVSFVAVLNACSHAGLLEEGCKHFELMKEVYGINPGVEHFTCMVDLFGRAGRLEEIKYFIDKNGISHLSAVWRAFLSSCRVHRNVKMAMWVSAKLLELEPFDAEPYILLSNTYAATHKWDKAAKLRDLMRQRNVKKTPGQSWIQLKNRVHTFVMGDRSHPEEAKIYAYLEKLIGRLKEIGYSTDIAPVLQDIEEEEQKELVLGVHSEKLALACGLMSSSCGAPVRIMKNLRVCNDCHNFMKYTSHLLRRDIIVRDINRFHHFSNGQCSCGDYW